MVETVQACPKCDAASPHNLVANSFQDGAGDPDANWWCRDCGAYFREANERPALGGTDTRFGLSKRLDDADPDAIGGDR